MRKQSSDAFLLIFLFFLETTKKSPFGGNANTQTCDIVSSSHIHQRIAYLLTSRKPSNCTWSLSPLQTRVINYQITYQICSVSVLTKAFYVQGRTGHLNPFILCVPRRSTPLSSMRVFTFLRQTEPETLEISRAAEVFQTTLQVLKNRVRQRHKRDVTASGRIAFFFKSRGNQLFFLKTTFKGIWTLSSWNTSNISNCSTVLPSPKTLDNLKHGHQSITKVSLNEQKMKVFNYSVYPLRFDLKVWHNQTLYL